MVANDINNSVASDLTNAMKDFSVDTQETDGAGDSKETKYTNDDWSQQLGYYKSIPELRSVIDAKATWTIGKGIIADEQTEMLINTIKGWGKDSFNTILENMLRTMMIGGDAFAEIIRDEEDNLINLKPLDPSRITIVANKKGVIIRYEQNRTIKGSNPQKLDVDKIFHLARNRVADEIHGVSMINSLTEIILMKNEAMADMKILMHRHVVPRFIYKLDTDDKAKIAAFKAKEDKANAERENIYIPMGTVEMDTISVSPNATLNPMTWINYLDNLFYEVAGVPKIILGGSGEFTEASAKIAYLAFQQNVEEDQLFCEEQTLNQLNILIELEFPASLENELLSDDKKDGDLTESKPSETTAGEGE